MARVLERVMSREVGGMMEGVQRVAGVAQAGGEGFALAGDGVRVDFSTGLRGGIGDSGNETADDGGGNDGQDGAGRGKGGAGNEEERLRKELRNFLFNIVGDVSSGVSTASSWNLARQGPKKRPTDASLAAEKFNEVARWGLFDCSTVGMLGGGWPQELFK